MRVLLVNPVRKNEVRTNLPPIVKEERGCNPPLGLLYIAAYLEKYANHEIKIIDAELEKLDYDSLASRIAAIKPDVVGITAVTMLLVDVLKTAGTVKKINKDIRVILGGPHAHLFPNETINSENIDYLVLGEGEEVFKELLDCLDDKPRLRGICGLVFKDNGEIVNTGMRPTIKNLDQLPFPARHFTLYQKYTSLLTEKDPTTTVITSRGCPFNCSFCERSHMGAIFRSRSAKNVVDELEECTKIGIFDFLFYDDTFTIDRKRVIDICREILSRGLNIRWDIRTRVDTIDEEMLKYLKKAGCCGIHYGVEAGRERILRLLNKHITLSQVKDVFDLTRKYGIPILAYFMIGNPTETKDDIYTTFKLMKSLKPDYVHISILSPFPGTKIYREGLKAGIIKRDYWKEFAEKPTADFEFPYWEELFTRGELYALLVKGYKSFYMRPSYILKRIKYLRSFAEFKKKAAAGLKVFFMK